MNNTTQRTGTVMSSVIPTQQQSPALSQTIYKPQPSLIESFDVINSSTISRIQYDPKTFNMYITFTSGKTYTAPGVTKDLFDEFVNAPSKGKFFNSNIKSKVPK